jgi:death-on-curing protein
MLAVIHAGQLREHGGSEGVRDEGLVEASLARPRHKWAYAARPHLADLAAAYAFGLARNHGFVDGNKRTAFMTCYVFVALNGHELVAEEAEVVATIEALAAGRLTEAALARWIRARLARATS